MQIQENQRWIYKGSTISLLMEIVQVLEKDLIRPDLTRPLCKCKVLQMYSGDSYSVGTTRDWLVGGDGWTCLVGQDKP